MTKIIELPNGRSWKTQAAAIEHFKGMLARYADNAVIEDRADHDDLVALLERYDSIETDSPSKIGRGVDSFVRRQNPGPGYSTPSFWVRRVDGSETDFSFRWAIKGEAKTNAQEFYDACRHAIGAELAAAKRRHFKEHGDAEGRVPCELSGQLITIEESHLDHAYPTFGHIVVTFRAARGWQHGVPEGVLSKPGDGQTTTTFIDPAIATIFRDFHHASALLRIVARQRNLAMAAGQRRPKVKLPVTL